VRQHARFLFLLPLFLAVIALVLMTRDGARGAAQEPEPGVDVDPTNLTVSEPTGTGIFTLSLTTEPTATVVVSLTASNLECDVLSPAVTLSTTNWLDGVTVTVTAVDDDVADGPQTCVVFISPTLSADPNYQGIEPDDVIVTVLDDEAGVVVTPTTLTVSEPDGTAIFTFSLTSEPAATVSTELTAHGGECSVSPGLLQVDATNWRTGVTATVTAVDDDVIDGPQLCNIETGMTQSLDSQYHHINPTDVTVTVEDDDGASITVMPTALTVEEPAGTDIFTLSLTTEPTATVVVSLTASNLECDVLTPAVTLSTTNWLEGVTVTVTAVDDDIADGPQTCLVTTESASDDPNYDQKLVDDVTVTVLDNDEAGFDFVPDTLTVSETGTSDTFLVKLTSEPVADVIVPLVASDNTECSVSPGSVTLTDENWDVGVSATVSAVDDDVADGNQTCTIETGPTESGDTDYVGKDPEDVAVTVEDDDVAGLLVVPTVLTLSEPDGSGVFTMTLTSEPTADVTVPLMASNAECSVSPALVTLTDENWDAGVGATVTAEDDDVVDGSQVCIVQTGTTDSGDGNYDGLDPVDVTVTVEDDDEAGVFVFSQDLTISEPDGSSVFTMTLLSQPIAQVEIGLLTSNNQCAVSPDLVTLTEANWRDGMPVTVWAVDDDLIDGEQTCTVFTQPAASLDPLYDGLNPPNLVFVVQDDDRLRYVYLPAVVRYWPPIPKPPTMQPISNPGGVGSYTVSWSGVPLADRYVLEESTDSGFSQRETVYSGPLTSQQIAGRGAARYYYRVKAQNEWGDSAWSGVVWTDVIWEAEPNDSAGLANGPLVAGVTYHGTFPSAADVQDYFRVRLSSPGRLELWLTQIPAGQDYNLVLRDSGLAIRGYSALLSNADEYILTGLLPAGEYYVQVYHASAGGSLQPYNLRFVYR
jgi:hypothetical protein